MSKSYKSWQPTCLSDAARAVPAASGLEKVSLGEGFSGNEQMPAWESAPALKRAGAAPGSPCQPSEELLEERAGSMSEKR